MSRGGQVPARDDPREPAMCVYVRALTEAEREEVEGLARSPDAVTYRRARTVLLSAQGERVPEIMQALGLSDRTVRSTIHHFNQSGVASLQRRKAPGRRRLCDDRVRHYLLE